MERENHFCSLYQAPRLLSFPVLPGGLCTGRIREQGIYFKKEGVNSLSTFCFGRVLQLDDSCSRKLSQIPSRMKLVPKGAFHLFGKTGRSGGKSNGTGLSTGNFSEKRNTFRGIPLFPPERPVFPNKWKAPLQFTQILECG